FPFTHLISSVLFGAAPRLPPFPTRRSSDLPNRAIKKQEQPRHPRQALKLVDLLDVRTDVTAQSKQYRRQQRRQLVNAERSPRQQDRKSTRLNSSHVKTSYAVFCLKKKTSHT